MLGKLRVAMFCFFACQPAVPSPPAPADASPSDVLDVSYAGAQLQLAQANLQRVERMNQRVARAVPASVIAEYRRDVDVAKAQFQQAEMHTRDREFSIWLRRAEADWKSAETTLKYATAANTRSSGTFGPLDLERFRLRTQVASLQVQRGQRLAGAERSLQLQWQIDVLNDEVARLKEESRMAPFIRSYPIWWY